MISVRWQSCQSVNELNRENLWAFFKIEGFAGKRSLLSPPPPPPFHIFALTPFFARLQMWNFVRFVRERLLRRLPNINRTCSAIVGNLWKMIGNYNKWNITPTCMYELYLLMFNSNFAFTTQSNTLKGWGMGALVSQAQDMFNCDNKLTTKWIKYIK